MTLEPGGGAGETYVPFGPLTAGALRLPAGADIIVNGIEVEDQSSVDVAVGDVNNKGVADLVVGAYARDPGGRPDAGETYIPFGEAGGVPVPGLTSWGLIAIAGSWRPS